jgi:hypothetical protein
MWQQQFTEHRLRAVETLTVEALDERARVERHAGWREGSICAWAPVVAGAAFNAGGWRYAVLAGLVFLAAYASSRAAYHRGRAQIARRIAAGHLRG